MEKVSLPTKRVFILMLVAFVFILTLLMYKNGTTFLALERDTDDGGQYVLDTKDQDSDGDGVADWEESFFGTDPNNPDTDGDGIPDNLDTDTKNILTGLEDSFYSGYTLTAPEDQREPTGTDILASSFMSRYLATKSASSGELGAQEIEQIVNSTITGTVVPINYTLYTLADLNIGDGANALSVEKYGEEVGEFLKTNFKLDISFDYYVPTMRVFSTLLEEDTADSASVEILRTYSKLYDDAISFLVNLEKIPPSAAPIHLSLINLFSQQKEINLLLSQYHEDPYGAVSVIPLYDSIIEDYVEMFEKVFLFFESNDVMYPENSNGWFFKNLIFRNN